MRRTLTTALTITLLLGGCKAKEIYDQASAARDLEKRGTMDVLKEASNDNYTAPADGRLTEAQVQMYLKVRDHERVIAQAAKAKLQAQGEKVKKEGDKSLAGMVDGFKSLNTVGEFLTADIRAAKDLHYNTAEYQWVKGQILSASASVMGQKLGESMNASMDQAYQEMKKSAAEATDEATKKMYTETLASMDKQREEAAAEKQKEDPALVYNREFLARHENALNAFASEMSKFEDKPGETQKNMEQWQKDLDKQKADTQQSRPSGQ